jgi:hypothetical protein
LQIKTVPFSLVPFFLDEQKERNIKKEGVLLRHPQTANQSFAALKELNILAMENTFHQV